MLELPPTEFHQRIRKLQDELQRHDMDALLAFAHEAEPANVRYLSDYWPSFETAAVLVPAEGEALLLIGPESGTFAAAHSKIPQIRRIVEFRESSDPEYPGAQLDTFESVFAEISATRPLRRLAIAGENIMVAPVYLGIKRALGDRPLLSGDSILRGMRMIKSENELALMRQAYKLAEKGLEAALNAIEPGMTEIQVAAEAEYAMLASGAETTGFPIWCCSGPNTNQAISRSTHRKLQKGDLVQLCVGARVGGYSSSVSRPAVLGKPSRAQLDLINVGLAAAEVSRGAMRAGVLGSEVQAAAAGYITKAGYGDYILYGPAHGIGLMECEHPFIESTYTHPLAANMTFAVDTWLSKGDLGIRFEDGARITETGIEELSSAKRMPIVLD